MLFTDSAPLIARLKRELPPAPPVPGALQTMACRLWPLSYLEHCRARYGARFTIYPIDMPPLIFLSDPGDIKTMFGASPTVLHPGAGGAVVTPLFGESSFVLSEGEEHRCGRSAVLPAFNRKATSQQAEMVLEVAERAIASWPVGSAFPIHPRLGALTLRVVLHVAFSGERGSLEELHAGMLAMLAAMASPVLQEPRLRYLPGWGGTWRVLMRRRAEVDRLIFALIRARRRTGGAEEDLLGLLLAAQNPDGSPLSDGQVRDDLVSVLIAGHETTASQLAWAFQLLAHNPAVQERLVEELGDGETPYLDATVHEVLRHRPVFLFAAPRAVVEPIEIGGWSYRPPVQLLGCNYLVHHDPAIYSDPQAFRPERFLDRPPSPRTLLPWGGGRRRCVGQHLATLQLQTVLGSTLASRRVLPASKQMERPIWRTVLVAPHAGSRVILHPRRRPPRRRGSCRLVESATV